MSGNGIHAYSHQDGSAGGGHDAVVGGSGYAHPQHNAAQHSEDQRNEYLAAGQGHDSAQQLGGKACDGDASGDDARHAAGHCHSDGTPGTALQGADKFSERQAVVLFCHPAALLPSGTVGKDPADDAHDNGDDNGQGCTVGHGAGIAPHQIDQDHQRGQEVNLLHQGAGLGQLLSGDPLQAKLPGLQVDGNVNAGKIQHRRQDRAHSNRPVRLAGKLRHQEGCRTHNGRHDLTAGGGSGLHSAGKLALVAHTLHHGDGNGAGTNRVGH